MMGIWFTEEFVPGMRFSLRIQRTLFSGKSRYQKIDVIETEMFGRVLLLDNYTMFSEKDEFVYHEMLVHPPLLAHPGARRVCVVGGGDGGAVRELLKHPGLESIVLCEIDDEVIRVCKEYFPDMAASLSDPRVTVNIEDAVGYIRQQRNEFDIILADTTDPTGPAVALFEEPFYASVKKALRPNGIFIGQIESLFLRGTVIPRVMKALRGRFKDCRLYGATIPTYPTGYWNFVWASDGVDPFTVDEERQRQVATTCRYYTPDHQRAAFVLPEFAKESIV